MIAIYKITNLINNKIYIGQSWNIKKRWHEHRNYKTNKHLNSSILKYGLDNFSFKILQELNSEGELTQYRLNELEKFYIKRFESYNPDYGYNKTYGGEGVIPTEETRIKISNSNKGIKHRFSNRKAKKITEEYINNLKKVMIGINKGRQHSEQSRKNMSEAHKGKKLSEEQKKKISDKIKTKGWKIIDGKRVYFEKVKNENIYQS